MTNQFEEMLEQLRERLADKYEVESLLGAGGMGAVYLARDIKHDRSVAIKVLHPEFAQSLGAERFLREVSVTAKLSHPHILPLYDSGDADGYLYYVMPLIEGEDLSDRIERDKQLPIKEAVHLAKEVAEALGYAHSLGLVHRDIKPGNIMLSGGHAIVVDFGIARAVDAAGGEKITQTGMSVGTPAYMSPEQSVGDSVDGRADLYSLGCVLYEMLVGQIPFTGPTPMAIMARHTMDNVPPPTIMREAIPDELEDVIMQAMAKTPADRFQTGMEMAESLDMVDVHTAMHRRPSIAMRQSGMVRQSMVGRQSAMFEQPLPLWRRMVVPAVAVLGIAGIGFGAWAAIGSGGGGGMSDVLDPDRIAVLYFEDLSSDSALAPIADGLTEALIDELGRANVNVVSRNGVLPYRDGDVARDSIARALDVGTLVVGQLEPRAGGNVMVTTRLVDGNTGEDVGERETFTIASTEIISARDSVAVGVSNSLRSRIGGNVDLRASRLGTESVEAWAAFRRAERQRQEAEDLLRARSTEGVPALLAAADSLLQVAEQADPDWMDPVVSRGWVFHDRSQTEEGERAGRTIQEGLDLAERALRADARNADALHLRGTLRFRLYQERITTDEDEWNQLLFDAIEDLEGAVDLDPRLSGAYVTLSVIYYEPQVDRVPDAAMAARQGLDRDPYQRGADRLIDRVFWAQLDQESLRDAQDWCERGAERFPDAVAFRRCQLWLLVTERMEPDTMRAQQLLAEMDSLLPDAPAADLLRAENQVIFGGIVGRAGDTDRAREILEASEQFSRTSGLDDEQELVGYVAMMYTQYGEVDAAIDLLKRYVAANPHHNFAAEAGTVWWWRPVVRSPRWEEVARLGR